jgi:hypothetical protein
MDDTTASKSSGDEFRDDARRHMRNARDEMRASFESLLPPEFVQHRRRARREMLLAWRSFIDRAIQRIDEKETEA